MPRLKKVNQEPTAAEFINIVERRKKDLLESTWYAGVLEILKDLSENPPKRIRCLGLGEPSEWINSQYQLAFLNLLQTHFDIDPKNVTLWDPIFTPIDVKVFEELHYSVVEENPTDKDTLWYLPHAPISLMIKLADEMTVFLGNDMSDFEPRVELSEEDKVGLKKLQDADIKSIKVSKHDRWFTAMNDFALHMPNAPTASIIDSEAEKDSSTDSKPCTGDITEKTDDL